MKLKGTLYTAGASLILADGATGQTTITSAGTASRVLTLPDATDTLVGKATTDTLTNKRLTSPKINEDVALTTTATKLNYLTSATGTTGTASTNVVFSTSPTLVTPTLGVASATSINKVAFTAPATGSTLTIADGKTLTASNTLTLTGDDGSSVAFGAGGTVAFTGTAKLSDFAATTSAELRGVISDETGSGALVFATSPTLVTPVLGVATATTINKVTLTAPAAGSTLTIADGKTLTASNTLTFTGTDSSTVACGAGGTVAYVANKLSAFAATTSAELAGVISDETGSGALVFGTSPTIATPTISTATHRGDLLLQNEADTGTTSPALILSQDPDLGTNTVTLRAPSLLSASYNFILPSNDGDSGQFLKSSGSGAVSWDAVQSSSGATTRGISYAPLYISDQASADPLTSASSANQAYGAGTVVCPAGTYVIQYGGYANLDTTGAGTVDYASASIGLYDGTSNIDARNSGLAKWDGDDWLVTLSAVHVATFASETTLSLRAGMQWSGTSITVSEAQMSKGYIIATRIS